MKICVATVLSIALLLGNSVNLRASATGPVPSDGDGPASQAGQTCCQETAAIVGILQGSKGDAGQKGQKGQFGPVGPWGLKGAPGVKGQKGEPGEKSGDSNQRVAFTVKRTTPSDTSRSYDTRLPFEESTTLLPGTSFDLETSTFTCSVPGTYVFMFSACKYYPGSSELTVILWKNGVVVVAGTSHDSSYHEQVSGSAVLVLQREDTVHLTMQGRTWSHPTYHQTAFSGFLLYPE